MNWRCPQIEERLSDYLDELLPAEEHAAFTAHLKECSECALLAAQVGGAVRMMRAAPVPEPPAYLYAKILDATVGPRKAPENGWRRWFGADGILWQPQFAMGAVTVAASFLILLHATGKSGSGGGFVALSPEGAFRQADRQAHVTYAHTAKFVSDLRLVYEIESRLQPQAEPATFDPQREPAPGTEPGAQPGQPRSEQRQRPEKRVAQARNLYASVAPEEFLASAALTSSVIRSTP